MLIAGALGTLTGLGVTDGHATDIRPLGPEFQVNSYTSIRPESPTVAATAGGDFLVLWNDDMQGGIEGRRVGTAGTAIGGDFNVASSAPLGHLENPDLAAQPGSGFIAVWDGPDGSGDGIFARRLATDGAQLGLEFAVNSHTPGDQRDPAVAVEPDGEFIVVWAGDGGAGHSGIVGSRFSSTGELAGTEFLVDSNYFDHNVSLPVVTADESEFVVLWSTAEDNCGFYCNVFAVDGRAFTSPEVGGGQTFRLAGAPLVEGAFELAGAPALAGDPSGPALATWTGVLGGPGDTGPLDFNIRARTIDGSGAIDIAGQINFDTFHRTEVPTVARLPGDQFVVAWELNFPASPLNDPAQIQARVVNSSGTAVSREFQLSSTFLAGSLEGHTGPDIASTDSGAFVVVWRGPSSEDPFRRAVWARAFETVPSLFTDGFESEDTCAWSTASPGSCGS